MARLGIVGLRNLGNTCFINSAVQCLSHTLPLSEYFLRPGWEEDIASANPLGTKGNMATVFAALVRAMWLETKEVGALGVGVLIYGRHRVCFIDLLID
jgi:ubiquitin C-terminal hydrolase